VDLLGWRGARAPDVGRGMRALAVRISMGRGKWWGSDWIGKG